MLIVQDASARRCASSWAQAMGDTCRGYDFARTDAKQGIQHSGRGTGMKYDEDLVEQKLQKIRMMDG